MVPLKGNVTDLGGSGKWDQLGYSTGVVSIGFSLFEPVTRKTGDWFMTVHEYVTHRIILIFARGESPDRSRQYVFVFRVAAAFRFNSDMTRFLNAEVRE